MPERHEAGPAPVRARAVRSMSLDDPVVGEELVRREGILRRWLTLGDGLAALIVFVPLPFAAGDARVVALALLGGALVLLVNRLAGLHRPAARISAPEALGLTGVAAGVAIAAWLAHLALTGETLPPAAVALVWAGGVVALLAGRELARLLAARAAPAQRWLLLDEGERPAYDRLQAILHEHAIDRVVRVPPELAGESAMRIARRAAAAGVWVATLPEAAGRGRALS